MDIVEGSAECKEKHAKGECKGHKPGEVHKHDEAKKEVKKEDKK
jgi:hypothetical protein